jgi:hypothetical protein
MTAPDAMPRLDYATPMGRNNKKQLQGWGLVAVILLTGYLCRNWPTQIWNDIRLYYFQQQCLGHPVPPGVVVYSSGPPAVSVRSPQCAAVYGPCPFKLTFGAQQSVVTIFTGKLQASNGIRRFVTVEGSVDWKAGKGGSVGFATTTSQLGRADTALRGLAGGGTYSFGLPRNLPNPQITVYSARPDANDLSHISFDATVFNEREHWDGHLQPDGSLKMTESATYSPFPTTASLSGAP